jgi:hypothetical protein
MPVSIIEAFPAVAQVVFYQEAKLCYGFSVMEARHLLCRWGMALNAPALRGIALR